MVFYMMQVYTYRVASWNPKSAITHGEGHSENVYIGI